MPTITSPANNSTHPAGGQLKLEGTGGPIVSITITIPGQPNVLIPVMGSNGTWTHTITLPNNPNTTITITVTNDTGGTASRIFNLS